jgi:hypothetical protein
MQGADLGVGSNDGKIGSQSNITGWEVMLELFDDSNCRVLGIANPAQELEAGIIEAAKARQSFVEFGRRSFQGFEKSDRGKRNGSGRNRLAEKTPASVDREKKIRGRNAEKDEQSKKQEGNHRSAKTEGHRLPYPLRSLCCCTYAAVDEVI